MSSSLFVVVLGLGSLIDMVVSLDSEVDGELEKSEMNSSNSGSKGSIEAKKSKSIILPQ